MSRGNDFALPPCILCVCIFRLAKHVDKSIGLIIEAYQNHSNRPCTIINLEVDENLVNFQNFIENPNFQFVQWEIKGLNINESLVNQERNFEFSSGCTFFMAYSYKFRSELDWFMKIGKSIKNSQWFVFGQKTPEISLKHR